MAWFTRFTRFGDGHLVFGQEHGMSCGLACTNMLVFKINKLQPGITAVHTENQIIAAYKAQVGKKYDTAHGTFPEDLVKILNKLTRIKWTNQYLSGAAVSQLILEKVGVTAAPGPTMDVTPIIVGVDWLGGGAHWVCIDTVRSFMGKKYATVCDPWDGDVHVTPIDGGKPFAYTAKDQPYSWDLRSLAGKVVGDSATLDRVLGKMANKYSVAGDRGVSQNWGVIHQA